MLLPSGKYFVVCQKYRAPLAMTWSYRVVRKDGYLVIHEAYYDESGNVRWLSVDPFTLLRGTGGIEDQLGIDA